MSGEDWRPIPGFPRYEVSNLGRVRSFQRSPGPRLLSNHVNARGYLAVNLRAPSGRNHVRMIHQLIMRAFVGEPPKGHETRHLDGNSLNNQMSNLAYGTRRDNVLDQVRHGVHGMASRTHCPAGHPYDDANTARRPSGARRCRTCEAAWDKRRRAARKAAA